MLASTFLRVDEERRAKKSDAGKARAAAGRASGPDMKRA